MLNNSVYFQNIVVCNQPLIRNNMYTLFKSIFLINKFSPSPTKFLKMMDKKHKALT